MFTTTLKSNRIPSISFYTMSRTVVIYVLRIDCVSYLASVCLVNISVQVRWLVLIHHPLDFAFIAYMERHDLTSLRTANTSCLLKQMMCLQMDSAAAALPFAIPTPFLLSY